MVFALGARARASGARLISFPSIESTNAEALIRARAGERGPLWLVTDCQTAGRGRRDRSWISPRGNLAASCLEVMPAEPAQAATLGFAAALALDDAIRALLAGRGGGARPPLRIELKWPNDVLANGCKLSGTLLEAEAVNGGLAVVVGTGINVVSAPTGTPTPATSLQACGLEATAQELFTALSDAWSDWRSVWDLGRGFTVVRKAWLDRAGGLGRKVSVLSGGSTVEGIFEEIDDAGCLVMSRTGGERTRISAGDVYFGDAASAGAN